MGAGAADQLPGPGWLRQSQLGPWAGGAITQRALNDKLFLAFLLQQTWSKNAAGETKATPIGINPILVFQLGKGWYAGNGDFVMKYAWDAKALFIPFGVRLGKAFIQPDKTWNAYIEYSSSLVYDDWQGSAASHAVRINVQYQIPVALGG